MRYAVLGSIAAMLVAAGCTAIPEAPAVPVAATITALECAQVMAQTADGAVCVDVPPGAVLLQTTESAQVTLRFDGISLTFSSTVFVSASRGGQMTVSVIEGLAVVGAVGLARVVHPGAQVTIPLGEAGISPSAAPDNPQPYSINIIRRAPLEELPRVVTLPVPAAPPTAPVQAVQPVQPATGCMPRAEWAYLYTVQRGDTLSRIASQQGISVTELQTTTCIANPNLLAPGDVLRLPAAPGTVQTALDGLRTERDTLTPGECTLLTWSRDDASLVYFQGEPVARTDSREVCPQATTTYTLLILEEDGHQMGYTVAIHVEPQAPATGE
jgi:LysM repeat protein